MEPAPATSATSVSTPLSTLAATLPRSLTAEQLPDDLATLKGMFLELLLSFHQQRRDNEDLQHRLDLLLRRLYGPRNERFDPHQLLLFEEVAPSADASAATPAAAAALPQPQRRCRPHGRRRLPDHLARESRHHELPEAARLCGHCGQVRVDIGVDKSEQLEYHPASLRVIEHLVHKYACRCCGQPPVVAPRAPGTPNREAEAMSAPEPERSPQPAAAATPSTPAPLDAKEEPACPNKTVARPAVEAADVVITAPRPPQPIDQGLPGPGLLAHLIVSKYVDHLPLYRLERIYERQGVFLPRSTLCDWLAASARLLRPLYEQLVAVTLLSRVLHTDDTTVKLQNPATHQLSTARLWAYLGDAAHPYNVFDFTRTRQRDGPRTFLSNYQGYLQADAFSGYDCLYLPDPGTSAARIIEVACNAHARRKFYEARSTDGVRSHRALAYYRQLYELEGSARRVDLSDAQRLQMRQDFAVPILKQFQHWLQAQQAEVLPKSPLGEAVRYTLNNWTALVRYTEAGYLAIDNNVSEREMKRIAIGRKNWLFLGSPQGGQTAAVLLSFTSTCTRLGVEPWSYLQDVLTRLPGLPAEQVAELRPDRWQAARAAAAPSGGAAPPTNTS